MYCRGTGHGPLALAGSYQHDSNHAKRKGGVEIYRTIRAHPDTLGSHYRNCKPLLHEAPRAAHSLDSTRVRRDLAQGKREKL